MGTSSSRPTPSVLCLLLKGGLGVSLCADTRTGASRNRWARMRQERMMRRKLAVGCQSLCHCSALVPWPRGIGTAVDGAWAVGPVPGLFPRRDHPALQFGSGIGGHGPGFLVLWIAPGGGFIG